MVYFQTKNPNTGKILEVLAMEDSGIFYDHFVYFIALLYIIWSFGIGISPFWYIVPIKIWQP
jgi:hypothetical protein